ncbi:MAG: hypothetical protein JWP01_2504 [Myxococcales bacterium]|nr:hypothetical protein [Myxococcales bacterium]
MGIQSFGDATTEDVFHGTKNARVRGLPNDVLVAAIGKLDMLNAAHFLTDLMMPPGNRLEALKGDRAGYHSIRINSQWRILFVWTDAGPTEVQIVDYH